MAILSSQKSCHPGLFQRWPWLLMLILGSGLPGSLAWSAGFNPAQIKSAFIYNLASFVEWPQNNRTAENTFIIAVLGDDEISHNLELLVRGEKIHGKTVVVKPCSSVIEAGDSHILFIGSTMQESMAQIVEMYDGLSTLVVGDSDAFVNAEGMVNLRRKDNRIKIEININAARKVGIRFNARLLKVAIIID